MMQAACVLLLAAALLPLSAAAALPARRVNTLACQSSQPVCSASSTFVGKDTGKCVGSTSPCALLPTDEQIKSIVDQHNKFRAHHGACPITWNQKIAEWSLNSPAWKKTCSPGGSMGHNSQSDLDVPGIGRLGENLAMQGSSSLKGVHAWDPANGVRDWYCKEEGCYTYGVATGSSNAGHFSQVVWKNSLELGCALCQMSEGMMTVYLICNYLDAGNFMGQHAANVGTPNSQATGCKAAVTPPPTTPDTPPPTTPPPTTPDTPPPSTPTTPPPTTPDTPPPSTPTTPPPTTPGTPPTTPDTPPPSTPTTPPPTTPGTPPTPPPSTPPPHHTPPPTGPSTTATESECNSFPCGKQQRCRDPSTNLNDYECSCLKGAPRTTTGKPADCPKSAPEDDDSSPPTWMWVLIVVAGVALVSSIVFLLFVRSKQTNLGEFIAEAEMDSRRPVNNTYTSAPYPVTASPPPPSSPMGGTTEAVRL